MRLFAFSPRRRSFLAPAAVLYAALWGACLFPFAWEGKLPGGPDGDTNCHAPYRAYLARMLWSGTFPDRASGAYFGYPILSIGQTAPLYPSTILDVLLPIPAFWFFLGDLWVHAVLASLGCAWLLRRRGHSAATALILGWVYANSSAFLFRTTAHWTLVHQAALIPWLLAAWEAMDRMRPGGMWRRVLPWTVLLALVILAQNPQWLYLLALLLAPLELLRMVRRRRLLSPPRRMLVLAGSTALAACLGAAALLPLAVGLEDSYRAVMRGWNTARSYSLPPGNLIGMVSPYFLFGNHLDHFLGRWTAMESLATAGRGAAVLALAGLAVLALCPKRWMGRMGLPVVLLLGGLFFATAPDMPYFRAVLKVFPLYDSFRAWGRGGYFVILGLILIAAPGLDALFSQHRRRGMVARGALVVGAICLLLAAVGVERFIHHSPEKALSALVQAGINPKVFQKGAMQSVETLDRLRATLRRDMLVYGGWAALGVLAGVVCRWRGRCQWGGRSGRAALLALPIALLFIELLCFQRFVYRQRSPLLNPETLPNLSAWLRGQRAQAAPGPFTVAIVPRGLLNFGLYFEGIRNPFGSDVNMPRRYAEWINAVQGFPPTIYQLEPTLRGYPPEMLDAYGLGARVEKTARQSSEEGWFRLDGHAVLVLDTPAPYAEIAPADREKAGRTQWLRLRHWSDDAVRIKVGVRNPVEVIVREFPDPRWRITVNGEVFHPPLDGDRLRIPVPAGTSSIRMDYVDATARFAVGLSLFAWLGLGAVVLSRLRKRRQ